MTFTKRTLLALAAMILSIGSAHADSSFVEIITDFCQEVAVEAEEASDELRNASNDLQECPRDFDDCQGGFFNDDPVSCIVEFTDCTTDAKEDGTDACEEFSRKLGDAYDDALREARQSGGRRLETRVQRFIENQGQACLAPAATVAEVCAAALAP